MSLKNILTESESEYDDILQDALDAFTREFEQSRFPSALDKDKLFASAEEAFLNLFRTEEFEELRAEWDPNDYDGDPERIAVGFVEWLSFKTTKMFGGVGDTAFIARVLKMGDIAQLNQEELGYHWTIPVRNIYEEDFFLSIDLDYSDEDKLYVLLAEVDINDLGYDIQEWFLFNDENEVGIMAFRDHRIKWLAVCRYNDVDSDNPKNSKILKQLI